MPVNRETFTHPMQWKAPEAIAADSDADAVHEGAMPERTLADENHGYLQLPETFCFCC